MTIASRHIFQNQYLQPNKILVVLSEGSEQNNISKSIPLTKGKLAIQGKTTAYVCEQGVCKLPTTDPHVFSQQISTIETISE